MSVSENLPPGAKVMGIRNRVHVEPITEAVELAIKNKGNWVKVDQSFGKQKTASSIGSNLKRGYLFVKAVEGERTITVDGRDYLAAPAAIDEAAVQKDVDEGQTRYWLWVKING